MVWIELEPMPAYESPISKIPLRNSAFPEQRADRKRAAELEPEPRENKWVKTDAGAAPGSSSPLATQKPGQTPPDVQSLMMPSVDVADSLEKFMQEWEEAERKPVQVATPPGGSDAPVGLPFAPDRLGKIAIRKRASGKEWIGKATGDSFAAKLQRTLELLLSSNPGKLNARTCGYLQEMFGLLPAGGRKGSKAFEHSLLQAFYSLGLDDAQWADIEALQRNFGQLDTSKAPEDCAEFHAQLREILTLKNRLLDLKKQEEEKGANRPGS